MVKAELLLEQKPISQDLKVGARCAAIFARGSWRAVEPVVRIYGAQLLEEFYRKVLKE